MKPFNDVRPPPPKFDIGAIVRKSVYSLRCSHNDKISSCQSHVEFLGSSSDIVISWPKQIWGGKVIQNDTETLMKASPTLPSLSKGIMWTRVRRTLYCLFFPVFPLGTLAKSPKPSSCQLLGMKNNVFPINSCYETQFLVSLPSDSFHILTFIWIFIKFNMEWPMCTYFCFLFKLYCLLLCPAFCSWWLTCRSCIGDFLHSDSQLTLANRDPGQVIGGRKQSEVGIFLPLSSFWWVTSGDLCLQSKIRSSFKTSFFWLSLSRIRYGFLHSFLSA